ncbi:MAG: ribonuclease Z [Elusimicrobiota bacterium]
MSAIELHVLGSGSFAPSAPGQAVRKDEVRNPPGYALRLGRETLLFDFGFGCLRQLVRAGLNPDEVSHVFFTHRHPDHVGDLPALLFYYRYDGKPYRNKLQVYGPRGFRNFVKHLTKAHHPWLRPRGFQLGVTELEEPALVKGGGWQVRCREVPHTTEALAYRFESAGRSVCYSGDTAYDEGLAGFAAQADVFVLECALADDQRTDGHMRVSEALELARRSRAKRVLLSHLSPSSDRALSRRLAGERKIRKAEDLLRVRIGR